MTAHLIIRVVAGTGVVGAVGFITCWAFAEFRAEADENWRQLALAHGTTAECVERLLRRDKALLQMKGHPWS